MDVMGHVNNVTYFRYFENARIEWLHSVGAPPNSSGDGPVIVNAFCNFLKQLEYPGNLRLKHYVAGLGRTNFETFLTIERTDTPGIIHANGGATTVWVNFKNQESVEIPQWLRALIE